jgi:hypothetical protein
MTSEPILSDAVQFTHRERLARIDQLLADGARERQSTRLAPSQLAMSGLIAGSSDFRSQGRLYESLRGVTHARRDPCDNCPSRTSSLIPRSTVDHGNKPTNF